MKQKSSYNKKQVAIPRMKQYLYYISVLLSLTIQTKTMEDLLAESMEGSLRTCLIQKIHNSSLSPQNTISNSLCIRKAELDVALYTRDAKQRRDRLHQLLISYERLLRREMLLSNL